MSDATKRPTAAPEHIMDLAHTRRWVLVIQQAGRLARYGVYRTESTARAVQGDLDPEGEATRILPPLHDA